MAIAANCKNLSLREGCMKWNPDLAIYARDTRHKFHDTPINDSNKTPAQSAPVLQDDSPNNDNKTQKQKQDDPPSCNTTIILPPSSNKKKKRTYVFDHSVINNEVGYSLRSRSRIATCHISKPTSDTKESTKIKKKKKK